MKNRIKNTIIALVFFLILFLFFYINGYLNDKKYFVKYINEVQYSGIISEIKIIEENRGFPAIKIGGDKWHYMGAIESKAITYIKLGDSIVKNIGESTIHVFRKDSSGLWVEKVFERHSWLN